MTVTQRVHDALESLSAAERRVAEVIVKHPQTVAFGTVAELASTAGAGAATVVRLAGKLGFDGFSALQASVQGELAQQLRPAAIRIREIEGDDVLGRTLAREMANLQSTFAAIDRAGYERIVDAVAVAGRVRILSGDASLGVARQFAEELAYLRDDVAVIDGNPVVVGRDLSHLRPTDLVLAVDLRRYDQWIIDAMAEVRSAGCRFVAVTDSPLSPLAVGAAEVLIVQADAVGPFDSHVAILALLGAVAASVAERLRESATSRLDRVEEMWRRRGGLRAGD